MGAWDSGPFDNDDAADWVAELTDQDTHDLVTEALEAVIDSDGSPPDASASSCAVAAAEVIAAARGHARRGFPAELKSWIRDQGFTADDKLARVANQAVEAVLDDSELAELWEDDRTWHKHLIRLIDRLEKPSKVKPSKAKPARGSKRVAAGASGNKGLIRKLKKLGAEFGTTRDGTIEGIDLSDGKATAADLPMIVGIESLTGLAINYEGLSDADLEQLATLPRFAEFITEAGKLITDEGLRHLAKCPNLKRLQISLSQVTDEGVRALRTCANLEWLDLPFSRVTGEGLESLAACANLKRLGFTGARISDEYLAEFEPLHQLEEISLYRTEVTADGVAKLQAALPKARIGYDHED